MRILFISDEESKSYWDFFKKEAFEGIDLIVSCGDLDGLGFRVFFYFEIAEF